MPMVTGVLQIGGGSFLKSDCDMQELDWMKIITAIVAVYGAALSTFSFVSQRIEKRRVVVVNLAIGQLTQGQKVIQQALFMSAANPGTPTVTLTALSLLLPNKRSLVFQHVQSDVRFPYELLAGQKCTVWFSLKEVSSALNDEGYQGKVKLIAVFHDALGTAFSSKQLVFDASQYS